MGVLNESFSYNPKTVKKETLKIDHLLKFACHAERTLMKGAWQAFSARKPKIKPRGPMTREEAVVVAVYRSQAQDDEIQRNKHTTCVWLVLESEHSSSRDEEWAQRSSNYNQRASGHIPLKAQAKETGHSSG